MSDVYARLCEEVEQMEDTKASDEAHAEFVGQVLRFIREDIGYIAKFDDGDMLREIVDRYIDRMPR